MKVWSKLNDGNHSLQNKFTLFVIQNRFIRSYVYLTIFILAIVIFLPVNSQNDLWAARANYLSKSPSDFWGGWSSVIFGNFPNFPAGWQSNVIAAQLAATIYGIYRLFRQNKGVNQYIVLYISVIFSTYNTRDSFLFSLLILAFSLLNGSLSTQNQHYSVIFQIVVFVVILSIAMAMRPWNILAVTLLVYGVNRLNQGSKKLIRRKGTIVITIFLITILPITLEISSTKLAKLEPAASIQQVIVMDMAANYCWGNNPMSNRYAAEGLQMFSSSPEFLSNVCSFYKPNVWVSLISPSAMSASGKESKFALINPGETELQNELIELWKNMILSDPPTYLTNKSMQFAQVVISGDGRSISLLNHEEGASIKELTKAFFLLPFEVMIIFHVFSVAFISLLLLLVLFFRMGDHRHWKLAGFLLAGNFLWAATTTVAFLGDNGRYTYPYTLLSVILLLSSKKQSKVEA